MFFELAQANVIAAALQNDRGNAISKKRSNRRVIVLAKLFFEGSRRRADDNTFTGGGLERCRNEVGQSLSHAGARFENRKSTLVHIAFHDFCVVELRRARRVIFDDLRKLAALFKELAHTR